VRLLVCIPALVFCACHSTEKVCNEAAQFEASVSIGTGYEAFESFEEGDYLSPVFGPQGGHHIWGSVQVTGFNPGDGKMVQDSSIFDQPLDGGGPASYTAKGHDVVSVVFTMSYPDDFYGPVEIPFDAFLEGDVQEAVNYGQTVFLASYDLLDQFPDEEEVEVEMGVTVTDACGTSMSDSKSFKIRMEEISFYY